MTEGPRRFARARNDEAPVPAGTAQLSSVPYTMILSR